MSYNPNGPRNTVGTSLGTSRTELESTTGRTTMPGGQQGTESTTDTLRNKASELGARASEAGAQVRERAAEIGHQVSDRASQGVHSVGERMSDMANSLRERAPESVQPYADRAANTLERAGEYLQTSTLNDFFDDMSSVVRRNPVPAMLTGVAVGFLLA
jgi:ElaB/YqjD/DUF883 family membrane-anchored ribosome-binding protein